MLVLFIYKFTFKTILVHLDNLPVIPPQKALFGIGLEDNVSNLITRNTGGWRYLRVEALKQFYLILYK